MASRALLCALSIFSSAVASPMPETGPGILPTNPSGLPVEAPAKIQDCSKGGDYAGAYTYQQGSYVKSDSDRRSGKIHCWNDYFLVQTSGFNNPWEQVGGDFYCTDTSICNSGTTQTTQTCITESNELSVTLGLEISNFSLEVQYQHTWSSQTCNTDMKNNQCIWDDRHCHTVWSQQQMAKQVGYKVERCNAGDGKGDYSNCMSDWEQSWPTDKVNYGCGSQCGDTNSCANTNGQPC